MSKGFGKNDRLAPKGIVLPPETSVQFLWWSVTPKVAKVIKLCGGLPLLGFAAYLFQNFLQLRGIVNLAASRWDLAVLVVCLIVLVWLITSGAKRRLLWCVLWDVLIIVAALGLDWWAPKPLANTGTDAPRSRFVIDSPPYLGHWLAAPSLDLQVGQIFFFNIHYHQSGPNPVEVLTDSGYALYIEQNYDASTQEHVIDEFKTDMGKRLTPDANGNHKTWTLSEGQDGYFSVVTSMGQRRVVTPADLIALHDGTEVVFVIAEFMYEDNNTIHHARLCSWLVPPGVAPRVWRSCQGGFDHSD